MADRRYSVSTENPFVPLCNEEDFQTVKRKRNNTDQSEDRVGLFMSSSPDDKAKTKYMCGSYYMVLKNRVGR